MPRALDTATLDRAAKDYAGHFLLPSQFSKSHPEVAIGGREWVLQNFFNLDFKDEFAHLLAKFKKQIGPDALADFDKEAKERFTPREDAVFEGLLAERLAITPDGKHLPGKIGTVKVASRRVGTQIVTLEELDSIRRRRRLGIPKDAPGQRAVTQRVIPLNWPVYAGEEEERAADSGVADPLPNTSLLGRIWEDESGALNTNVSVAFAIAGLDPALDLLDEGSADGVLVGRDGSQPVDPDAAPVGTILFEHDLGTPAFGAAGDDAPGALATAAAVADDTSANNTGTVTWCRASSSNSVPTPLNDHIDGSAGLTSGTFDFEYNTDAIVSGATVALTSWTVTQPQGPTAT